jgi:hypothetical protein
MPFDGTNYQPGIIRLFDDMLDFFGPDGERWIQGAQTQGDGGRCLLGALKGCRARLGMPRRDNAVSYLRRAIWNYTRYHSSLIAFNDVSCRQFGEIKFVIIMAREMAEHDDPNPDQLRLNFWS